MNDITASGHAARRGPAAPPHDYLTPAELNQLRDQIHALRDFALQRDEDGTEIDADTADPSDRATIEEDTRRAKAYAAHKRALLVSVEAALERLHSGDYGYCMETGEPIGFQRLAANPIATLSIEAQERLERRRRTISVAE
jgi:DnaK suppressor protein